MRASGARETVLRAGCTDARQVLPGHTRLALVLAGGAGGTGECSRRARNACGGVVRRSGRRVHARRAQRAYYTGVWAQRRGEFPGAAGRTRCLREAFQRRGECAGGAQHTRLCLRSAVDGYGGGVCKFARRAVGTRLVVGNLTKLSGGARQDTGADRGGGRGGGNFPRRTRQALRESPLVGIAVYGARLALSNAQCGDDGGRDQEPVVAGWARGTRCRLCFAIHIVDHAREKVLGKLACGAQEGAARAAFGGAHARGANTGVTV